MHTQHVSLLRAPTRVPCMLCYVCYELVLLASKNLPFSVDGRTCVFGKNAMFFDKLKIMFVLINCGQDFQVNRFEYHSNFPLSNYQYHQTTPNYISKLLIRFLPGTGAIAFADAELLPEGGRSPDRRI